MAKFEDITSTDQTSSYMAIASLDNIASDVFLFADIEILDANVAAICKGTNNKAIVFGRYNNCDYILM